MVSVVASTDATLIEPNPTAHFSRPNILSHSGFEQHRQMAKESQDLLGLLGQRYVQYYPALAQLTGSIKAALMLGHALYWTRHYLQDKPERDGWFWKNGQEWSNATGLSIDEQQSARLILTKAGLLEERTSGFPRRLHFRVNLHQLGHQLAKRATTQFTQWNWDNTLLRTLLGRPIAFFKPLADLTNGVSAALYLSHLLQAQRNAFMRKKVNRQGYFHCDKNETASLLVMGAKAVRNARIKLRTLELIDETLVGGYQVKLMARVNMGKLFQGLQHLTASSSALAQVIDFKRMADLAIPVSGKGHPLPESRSQHREKGYQSHLTSQQVIDSKGMAKTAIPVSGKGQEVPFSRSQYREKGQTRRGFTTLQKEEQPPQAAAASAMVQSARCCGDLVQHPMQQHHDAVLPALIFPPQLAILEQRAAAAMVRKVPVDQLQRVIDEWAGQLANPAKQIRNKLGYLRKIVSAAEQGNFVATVGLAVAQARARRTALEAQQSALQQQHDAAIQKIDMASPGSDLRERAFAEMRKILPMVRRTWNEGKNE